MLILSAEYRNWMEQEHKKFAEEDEGIEVSEEKK